MGPSGALYTDTESGAQPLPPLLQAQFEQEVEARLPDLAQIRPDHQFPICPDGLCCFRSVRAGINGQQTHCAVDRDADGRAKDGETAAQEAAQAVSVREGVADLILSYPEDLLRQAQEHGIAPTRAHNELSLAP